MRLRIVAVGRLKNGPERLLVERYVSRAAVLGRSLGLSGPEIVELPESRARRAPERRADEAARLRERLAGAPAFLLDETGSDQTSERFAARLGALRDGGTASLALVIGGPDGLDPGLAAVAEGTLAFGRMTLPHGLVRVLAAEQLYRALTILGRHPYHRGEGGDG